MIKQPKPRRQTVELRPSRIRRDPVLLHSPVQPKPDSPEREVWATVIGVTVFALAGTVLIVSFSQITAYLSAATAAPPRPRFDQCYNGGPDCVVDGDTIYLGGAKVEIAGIDAPAIKGAGCDDERNRGIDAAVELAELLNSGKVALAGTERGPDGQVHRTVEVDGRDVGDAMISAGAAREIGSGPRSWCD